MLYLRVMKRKLVYFFLLIVAGTTLSCSKFEKIRNSNDLSKRLEAAYGYYEEGEYYKAQVLFDETLPLLKGSEAAEKASFYRAQSYYQQKQYVLSAYYFKEFYDLYTRSDRAEESLYMAAKSLYNDAPRYNLDQTSSHDALRAFQKFVNRYPKSQYLEEVNQLTDEINKKLERKAFDKARLYYDLGKNNNIHYKSAVIAFGAFMKQYPSSGYVEEASWLQINSQFKLAQVSVTAKQEERYLEAIEFYENFVDQYPNSKFKKEAEQIYKKSLDSIKKIRS